MGILSRDQALAVARSILERSEADETEVILQSAEERFVRFAGSGPTQNGDRHRHQVSIRARVHCADGIREARATCDGIGDQQTSGALARAFELAQLAPPDSALGKLEGAYAGMRELGSEVLDLATLEHSFEDKAARVRQALALSKEAKLEPAGLMHTGGESLTIVNSAGREVHDGRTRASLSLTASVPGFDGGAGIAEATTERVAQLNPEEVFRRAIEKALMTSNARAIDPGQYTVLLEPIAVSSFLLFASYLGFGAQEVQEESSFLCGRIGQQLFPEALNVHDDANNAVLRNYAFDMEGTRKQRVPLIQNGVLQPPVTDADWARRLGVANTGHALAKPNTDGPKATDLVVAPGKHSAQELLAGIQRGLLITQFHYTNLIDPKDLLLTGMTRNGTFLVEGGEIVGAVKNLRYTESLVNALGNLSGIANEQEVAGALFDGVLITPAMRIENFRFTSSTDF